MSRTAWTRESVIAYLQENAGKIYDPQIVQVFLTILPKGKPEAKTIPGEW